MAEAQVVTTFKLKFTYFKPSGKYYTTGETTWALDTVHGGGAYMQDAVDRILKMRRDNEPAPGLSGNGEDFHVVVECEEGYPCMVTAERKN